MAPIPSRAALDSAAANDDSPRGQARAAAATKAKELRDALEGKLSKIPPTCRLRSLERSTAGELVLSNVVLDNCMFAGAHGLDKLRIGADCSFQRTARWWSCGSYQLARIRASLYSRTIRSDRSGEEAPYTGDNTTTTANADAGPGDTPGTEAPAAAAPESFSPPRMFTRRRLIAEEILWRRAHAGRKKRRDDSGSTPLAADIAGIYRDLRKGLEDVKNEPDAADFYYGEMEMRRLTGRGRRADELDRKNVSPSVIERVLLYGYWAVSGYGLRAWRAVTTLAVVLFGAAFLYMHPALATVAGPAPQIAAIDPASGAVTYAPPPPPAAPGFWTALEFSARESTALLQSRSMPAITTTTAGALLDIFLRLAGPVLLAFIVLALRARMKR